MQCRQCSTDLPDKANFCSQCGTKIELTCPDCGKTIPPDSKFCPECGHDLRKPPDTARIDTSNPATYTPKHLAEKILTAKSAIEGERKLVTILFADVAGSTAMFESMDPETVHEIMYGCFRILLDQIHRYEGTVNQFTGDGVMALFGAPIAHEDHSQRSCHAALAIQKALTPYRETLKQRFAIDFAMRIGINTGPVVVGAIGEDLRMDYTAQGETANLAARMQTLVQPGTICVSDAALAEIMIKGARHRPTVLAIEDLHWIDDSSRTAITELIDTIPAEPVLLVLTSRPQFSPDWGFKSYLHTMVLSRLAEDQILAMATHLLAEKRLDDEVSRPLLDKAEGVPFFIEELVRSYKDCLGQGAAIPTTIEGIVMARVDALPETAKTIVRTGSAIEREFGHDLIARATALADKELTAGIFALKAAEQIYQRGIGKEALYIFKHALTIDVVYASLLTSQKRQIHANAVSVTSFL